MCAWNKRELYYKKKKATDFHFQLHMCNLCIKYSSLSLSAFQNSLFPLVIPLSHDLYRNTHNRSLQCEDGGHELLRSHGKVEVERVWERRTEIHEMSLFHCTHLRERRWKAALNMILHNGEEPIGLDGDGEGDGERRGKKVRDGRLHLSVCACGSETANENTDVWFSRKFTGSVDAGSQPMSKDSVGTLQLVWAMGEKSAPDQTACRNHLSEGEKPSERKGWVKHKHWV